MDKADAVRKVISLEALAAEDSGASDHERSAAQAMSAKLRTQHEITDGDLATSEPLIFFGHDLFFWNREVEPLLEKAAAAIEQAIAKIDAAAMPDDRANGYVKLHQAVKHACEETGWTQSQHMRLKLKTRRNAVVQERYEQEFAQWLAHFKDYDSYDGSEDDLLWAREQAHKQAVIYTGFGIDLTERQIASIVRRPKA